MELFSFGGIALIPKIEIIIEWLKGIIPNLMLFDLGDYSSSILLLILISLITFYISGFWDYFFHRFMSHNRNLFFTHEYHHLPNKPISCPSRDIHKTICFYCDSTCDYWFCD